MIDGIGKAQPPGKPAAVSERPVRGAAQVGNARPQVAGGVLPAPILSSMTRISRDLAASPPVDTAKVNALRNAIAGGSYRVDADAIAAGIIRLERGSPKA